MNMYPIPVKPESIKSDEGAILYVNEGSSCDVDGRPKYRGVDISEAAILSLSYTLYDTLTKQIINERQNIDAKDTNDCIVNTDGSFIIKLDPLDNPILSVLLSVGQIEDHTIRITFTFTDGVKTRTGVIEKLIKVLKLSTPTL